MEFIIVLGIIWLMCGGLSHTGIFDKPMSMEEIERRQWKGMEGTQGYKDAIEAARRTDNYKKKDKGKLK